MKATGIVRRVDDLGRVVIPKEIRRTLRIREGDPLEIFTDKEGEVIFRKYSPLEHTEEQLIKTLIETFYTMSAGAFCAICDTTRVLAIKGKETRRFVDERITDELANAFRQRSTTIKAFDRAINPFQNGNYAFHSTQVIVPIICEGEIIGGVVTQCADEDITEIRRLAEFVANAISKNNEE